MVRARYAKAGYDLWATVNNGSSVLRQVWRKKNWINHPFVQLHNQFAE